MKKICIFFLFIIIASFFYLGCEFPMDEEASKKNSFPIIELSFSDLLAEQDLTSKAIDYNQFNGLRVMLPNSGSIFLVDGGKRRGIPNPETFNNLFRDWSVYVGIDVANIPIGTPITNGAFLAKANNSTSVFLIDNGQKRGITSPAAMDKYNFAWNKIQQVNALLLSYVPTGLPIY